MSENPSARLTAEARGFRLNDFLKKEQLRRIWNQTEDLRDCRSRDNQTSWHISHGASTSFTDQTHRNQAKRIYSALCDTDLHLMTTHSHTCANGHLFVVNSENLRPLSAAFKQLCGLGGNCFRKDSELVRRHNSVSVPWTLDEQNSPPFPVHSEGKCSFGFFPVSHIRLSL